ncbi:MAG: hypothetical protein KDK23_14525 [Leptospiraceae bacterium]|nr:hypothetical protein [Leptospiraceae bacterium]
MKRLLIIVSTALCIAGTAQCTTYIVTSAAPHKGDVYVTIAKSPAFGNPETYVARCKADSQGNLNCSRVGVSMK